MTDAPQKRRGTRVVRRKRRWSTIELGFFALTLVLTLLMTVTGVSDIARLIGGASPSQEISADKMVPVGGDSDQEDGDASSGGGDGSASDGEDAETPETGDPGNSGSSGSYQGDSVYGRTLSGLVEEYPQASYILRNLDLYPEEVLNFAATYPEAIPYAAAYLDYDRMGLQLEVDLSQEAESGEVPLLLQWDARWGYKPYGDGMIGWTGCGPTCLSMVSLYLNGWKNNDPYTIAQYAEENGYYTPGHGSSWSLMSDGSAQFGLKATEVILDENAMAKALEEGCPIICAMGQGIFTQNGHYIVLTGYADGAFTIRDPNSPSNSAKTWTYEQIKGEIKNIWSFQRA